MCYKIYVCVIRIPPTVLYLLISLRQMFLKFNTRHRPEIDELK